MGPGLHRACLGPPSCQDAKKESSDDTFQADLDKAAEELLAQRLILIEQQADHPQVLALMKAHEAGLGNNSATVSVLSHSSNSVVALRSS